MDVRVVLGDIDGTLPDTAGHIPPVNVTAIRTAVAGGVRFILASGLITEPEERERLYRYFASRMQGCASLIRTDPEYLEFTARGVTKGSSLTALAASLDVGVDAIAAIGDGDDDVAMIAGAGYGVAVRNAKVRVLEAARFTATATAGGPRRRGAETSRAVLSPDLRSLMNNPG